MPGPRQADWRARPRPGYESPTAAWIVGQDAYKAQSYITHTVKPSFIAKVSDDPDAGVLSGLSYGMSDDRYQTHSPPRSYGSTTTHWPC